MNTGDVLVTKKEGKIYSRSTKKPRIENGVELWHCSLCDGWLPAAFFGPAKTKSGLKSYCRRCNAATKHAEYNKVTLKKQREARWRRMYGITPEDAEAIKVKQGYKCAICTKQEHLCLDHDHKTGKIRGFLCRTCNMAIGALSDSIPTLQAAIDYLRSAVEARTSLTVLEGDVLDRHSILMLRLEHGDKDADGDLALYDPEARELVKDSRIASLYEELCDANRAIWNLESNIRQDKTGDMSLSDIGKAAIEIRNINRRRIAAKNAVNAIFGRFLDHKIDHVSEENKSSLPV